MIQVSAPAKIILFGEHAVVYGQPAIAVPVSNLRASASITPHHGFSIVAPNLNEANIKLDSDSPLAESARIALDYLNIDNPPAVKITVESQIPIASGLGSGAAIATAMIRVLCQYLEKNMSIEEINKLVYEVEKIHHGTPSGIDNTVIVYEQSVYFVREKPIQRIENAVDFDLLIANTGKTALTKIAVGDVRKLKDAEPERITRVIEQIGEISDSAYQAMRQGNTNHLGKLMIENHALLQQLTVSSPELDTLVTAATVSGALGAKLSGGGRGGNMIALVTDFSKPYVKQALLEAGAIQVFETTVRKS